MTKQSLGARTLLYPTPVLVIGSYDQAGRANVMTASWGGVCCSEPPCVAVSLRRATCSFAALERRRAFTVNIPSEPHLEAAAFFGSVSGRDLDKLAARGLTAVRSELVDAPLVAEFPLVLECAVRHVVDIGLHVQFIGEVLDVKADPALLDERGVLDIERLRPLVYAVSTQTFHGVGPRLTRSPGA